MKRIKQLLVSIFIIFAEPIFGIFFDKQYFRGRWFVGSRMGWIWLIKALWIQKILGFNRNAPIPIHHASKVSDWNNISFHPDNLDNFQSGGCYFQNYSAKIFISRGVYIAPNVGIITANHNSLDVTQVLKGSDVYIGEACWIGMNAVILPGVHLGPGTIVAAGAVVTKSTPEGHCVVAGVPAKLIRSLL